MEFFLSQLWPTSKSARTGSEFSGVETLRTFPIVEVNTVDDEGQSEKCVARCRHTYDAMRMIPPRCARVPQRDIGPISMRFLMIFLAVRMMSTTGNQLNLRDRPTVWSSPCGMPSPSFSPLIRSWTGLGYAANG